MKQKHLFLLPLFLLFACKDSLEVITNSGSISIAVLEGNYLVGKADTPQPLTIQISSVQPLKYLDIYKDGKSLAHITLEPVKLKTINYIYTPTKAEADKNLTFSFLVADEYSNLENLDISVYTAPTEFAFERKNITLQHFSSNSAYSWNLAENQASDSTEADIWIHSDSGEWLAGWESQTSTQFVKFSGGPAGYDAIYLESAILAYQDGAALQSLSNLCSGDIFIAKLRGSENYAVIKLEQVKPFAGDNSETITISYKKLSEFAGR